MFKCLCGLKRITSDKKWEKFCSPLDSHHQTYNKYTTRQHTINKYPKIQFYFWIVFCFHFIYTNHSNTNFFSVVTNKPIRKGTYNQNMTRNRKKQMKMKKTGINTYEVDKQRKQHQYSYEHTSINMYEKASAIASHLFPERLMELTFMGVATTSGASGESDTANLSCMNRLSTMDSSFSTIL